MHSRSVLLLAMVLWAVYGARAAAQGPLPSRLNPLRYVLTPASSLGNDSEADEHVIRLVARREDLTEQRPVHIRPLDRYCNSTNATTRPAAALAFHWVDSSRPAGAATQRILAAVRRLFGDSLQSALLTEGMTPADGVRVRTTQTGPMMTYFSESNELVLHSAAADLFAQLGPPPEIDRSTRELERLIRLTVDLAGSRIGEAELAADPMVDVVGSNMGAATLIVDSSYRATLQQRGVAILSEERLLSWIEGLDLRDDEQSGCIDASTRQARQDLALLSALPSPLGDVYHDYSAAYIALSVMLTQMSNLNSQYFGSGQPPMTLTARVAGSAQNNPNYPVLALELTAGQGGEAIYVLAESHARERLSVEVALRFLSGLINNYYTNIQAREILQNRDIIVMPMLNPEGLDYAANVDPSWRANRHSFTPTCVGVDLNRNFNTPNWVWGNQVGCVSQGSNPRYESETLAVVNEIGGRVSTGHDVEMIINYHSYSALVMYPYADSTTPPSGAAAFSTVANTFVNAIFNETGATYGAGQWGVVLYSAPGTRNGTLIDWTYRTLGTRTFTIELPPYQSTNLPNGFKPPASWITPTYEEQVPVLLRASLGKIVGVVRTPSGTPIAGASVGAFSPTTGQPVSTTTDASGNFALMGIPAGTVHVSVSKSGYLTYQFDGSAFPDQWGVVYQLTPLSGGCSSEGFSGGGLAFGILCVTLLLGRRRRLS